MNVTIVCKNKLVDNIVPIKIFSSKIDAEYFLNEYNIFIEDFTDFVKSFHGKFKYRGENKFDYCDAYNDFVTLFPDPNHESFPNEIDFTISLFGYYHKEDLLNNIKLDLDDNQKIDSIEFLTVKGS